VLGAPSRHKVLLLCLRAPWPPMGGCSLRAWQVLNALGKCADVALFALTGNREPPPRSPASVWRVTGRYDQRAQAQDKWLERPNGLPSDCYYDEESAKALRDLLERFAPDVVVFDQLWTHAYEETVRAGGARLVLNTHNIEAPLAREIAASESHVPAKLVRRVFAERVARLEQGMCERADQVWVCSGLDREWVHANYRVNGAIHVVPNAVDAALYRGPAPERPAEFVGEGPFFLFPGVFHYAPNQNAARFLIRDLFPLLAARWPQARLLLVGADPTPAMMEAAADPRIVVTGRVPEVAPYLRHASMMLVPLFEGGGTRFKIIEAFAARLPVVSTAKGAEGLEVRAGVHLLQAGDAAQFVAAAEEIVAGGPAVAARVASAAEFAETLSFTGAAMVERALRALQS